MQRVRHELRSDPTQRSRPNLDVIVLAAQQCAEPNLLLTGLEHDERNDRLPLQFRIARLRRTLDRHDVAISDAYAQASRAASLVPHMPGLSRVAMRS